MARTLPRTRLARTPKGDRLEAAIEGALLPGRFIGYRDGHDFENGLDRVKDEILALIKTEPLRVVALIETFIAGCYLKADELDDSDGSFGMFVEGLFCAWIRARQAAKADPLDTGRRLVAWMEKDNYGFCHQLEDEAVNVLNKAGLKAFEHAVREVLEAPAASGADADKGQRRESYRRAGLREVLKTIAAAKGDPEAYLAVSGSDVTPKDCETIADIHIKARRFADALSWTERGLGLQGAGQRWGNRDSYGLAQKKRELLKKLGRHGDALEAAWQGFLVGPSEYSYEDLMKYVPKAARNKWHAKAMAVAEQGDLHGYLGLCKKAKAWAPLAARILRTPKAEIEAISHYTTEPVAKGLAKGHPAAAAKVYAALGLRIVNAKKSKYYGAAIGNFREAKRCFETAGLNAEWNKVVKAVRADHHRKSGFIHAFEGIISGEVERPRPSFLDRARERWALPRTER